MKIQRDPDSHYYDDYTKLYNTPFKRFLRALPFVFWVLGVLSFFINLVYLQYAFLGFCVAGILCFKGYQCPRCQEIVRRPIDDLIGVKRGEDFLGVRGVVKRAGTCWNCGALLKKVIPRT